jgi:CRISPR-associated endonuclease/helicase Cas3
MLLAKSNPPRSFVEHSLDVARAAALRLRDPVLCSRLATAAGMPVTAVHAARLAVLAGLHDIGKTGKGFQQDVRRPRGERGARSDWRHVAGGLAALAVLHRELTDVLGWWSDPPAALYAAVCHHGGPVASAALAAHKALVARHIGDEAVAGVRALLAALREAYPTAWEAAPTLAWTPALDHLVAGLVMGADWVGSGMFPDLEAAYRAAGAWQGQTAPLLAGRALRPVQALIARVPLHARLVLIEDATGSGKTEAALLHAERLAGAGLISGLYFAVPTRSAATELHQRISGYLAAVPGLRGTVTRVVPGQIDTDGWQGRRPWHLGGARQALLARVGVGTIDQAMLSILAVRHGWMRAAWLVDRLLVIDEVHASDAYMETVVGSLVRRHLDLGGHVLCLSATLGESMRARLLDQPARPLAAAEALPYPVIWAGSTPMQAPADIVPAPREVLVHWAADPTHAVLRAARAGATVLVIRSTVAEAVQTWEGLRAQGAMLHHSRWADADRLHLDAEVMRRLGKESRLPGAIVVGTQTLEQSLDISADLLVTDACPGDVLLQRLGRLHRHARERPPGYEQPRVLILDPGDLELYLAADGRIAREPPQRWVFVYPLPATAATLEWLRASGVIRVPADNRALVERATHPDSLRALARRRGAAWEVLLGKAAEHGAAARQQGALAVVDWSEPYQRAQVGDEPTRLGDGTITVETPGLSSPLTGEPVAALPIPARWLVGISPSTPAMVDGQAIRIGTLALYYGSRGLERQ